MNIYIKTEITQMQLLLKNFISACERGAKKDDGKIDKDEQKTIDKIKKATQKYYEALEKIK